MKICSNKHDEIVHNSRDCPLCEALVPIEALETFGQFKPVQAVLPRFKTAQEEVPYPPIYKSLVMLPQNDSAPATNDVCKQETKAESSIFTKE